MSKRVGNRLTLNIPSTDVQYFVLSRWGSAFETARFFLYPWERRDSSLQCIIVCLVQRLVVVFDDSTPINQIKAK